MGRSLVLNATYEPLCVVSGRRAVVLVLERQGRRRARDRRGAALRAPDACPVPSVVRLRYVRAGAVPAPGRHQPPRRVPARRRHAASTAATGPRASTTSCPAAAAASTCGRTWWPPAVAATPPSATATCTRPRCSCGAARDAPRHLSWVTRGGGSGARAVGALPRRRRHPGVTSRERPPTLGGDPVALDRDRAACGCGCRCARPLAVGARGGVGPRGRARAGDRRRRRRGLGRVQRARGADLHRRVHRRRVGRAPRHLVAGRCSARGGPASATSSRPPDRLGRAGDAQLDAPACGAGGRCARPVVRRRPGGAACRGPRCSASTTRAARRSAGRSTARAAGASALKVKIAAAAGPSSGRPRAWSRAARPARGGRRQRLASGARRRARRPGRAARGAAGVDPDRRRRVYVEQPLAGRRPRGHRARWPRSCAVPVALDESIDPIGRRGDGVGPRRGRRWSTSSRPGSGGLTAALDAFRRVPGVDAGRTGGVPRRHARDRRRAGHRAGRRRRARARRTPISARARGTSTTTSPSRSSSAPTG